MTASPDPRCDVCGQPMIVYEANQRTHPSCATDIGGPVLHLTPPIRKQPGYRQPLVTARPHAWWLGAAAPEHDGCNGCDVLRTLVEEAAAKIRR